MIRKRIAEKAYSGSDQSNQEKGDDSTAPTNRTKTPEDGTSPAVKVAKNSSGSGNAYAALDDSLEGAQLNDLQKASSPLKMTLTARADRPGMMVRRADTNHSEILDQTLNKTIYNSCPENVRRTEAKIFLEKLGMLRFADLLFKHGFDDLDQLLDISDETLKQLEIPIGFRIKFNKSRAEHKASPKKIELELIQSSKDNAPYRPSSSYHELSLEEAENEGYTPGRVHKTQCTTSTSTEPPKTTKPKREQADASSGTQTTSTTTQQTAPSKCTTLYCYNCFQQVAAPHRSPLANYATFCSPRCLKFFTLERSIVCLRDSCSKVALKAAAAHSNQGWCCSEECAEIVDQQLKDEEAPNRLEIFQTRTPQDTIPEVASPHPGRVQIPAQVVTYDLQKPSVEQSSLMDGLKPSSVPNVNKTSLNQPKVEREVHEVDLDFDF